MDKKEQLAQFTLENPAMEINLQFMEDEIFIYNPVYSNPVPFKTRTP